MSPENTPSKTCPTCGSPLGENATRCLVCGHTFAPAAEAQKKPSVEVKAPRLPNISLSLPIALLIMLILLGIGAGVVFAVLRGTGRVVEPTATATLTITPTVTLTPTATSTATQVPTPTPLPPIEYVVKSCDNCGTIALTFKVSTASIIVSNNLDSNCTTLVPGQTLRIPQPTPTWTPPPTSTLSAVEATDAACQKISYTVTANDTLSGIADMYNVSIQSIKDYNGLPSDSVWEGQKLDIPLCERLPTPGPTPTATPPPPYPAVSLLLPADGSAFMNANDVITLQWAAVSTLLQNEAYAVTIEDVTSGDRRLVEYVTDTKFIVPANFRPADSLPHIMRWYVTIVRQTGTTNDDQPIYSPAGAISTPRVFTWWSSGVTTPNP